MPDNDRVQEHAMLLAAAASQPGVIETLRLYQIMASHVQEYYLVESLVRFEGTKVVGATNLVPLRSNA